MVQSSSEDEEEETEEQQPHIEFITEAATEALVQEAEVQRENATQTDNLLWFHQFPHLLKPPYQNPQCLNNSLKLK